MTTDTTPLVKALLWAGIEDYCPLWQAVWEVNTLLAEESPVDRTALTRSIVRSLLDEGAIELVWQEGETLAPIDLPTARVLTLKEDSWAVRHAHERQVCLSATPLGEERYRQLAQG